MSTSRNAEEAERTHSHRRHEDVGVGLPVASNAASPAENREEVISAQPSEYNTTASTVPMARPSASSTSSSVPPTAAQAAQMFVFSAAKAGMNDVDKDHVQKVVFEMSKDSLFFQNSIRQNDKVEARIAAMRAKLKALTAARRETLRRQIDAEVAKLETTRDLTRTKVVVDMDMFYAAVEMRDNPALRDVPLAVGGNSMLSTTNYVARKFGVRAAMPGFIGKELCPELVIVPCNFDKYTAISRQIRTIVEQYDPDYSAMSLDEVYCDITDYMENHWPRYTHTGATTARGAFGNSDGSGDDEGDDEDTHSTEEEIGDRFGSDEIIGVSDDEDNQRSDEKVSLTGGFHGAGNNPHDRKRKRTASTVPTGQREAIAAVIVNEIRQKIFETTQLTASAGIASNTMLAKICSDFNKPNGQYVLPFTRDDVLAFVETLPVRKIGGIGKVMEKTLSALEITTGKELYDRRVEIFHLFSGRTAAWLLRISMGLRNALSDEERSGRKSYSRERTFSARGIGDPKTLEKICEELCEMLATDMEEGGYGAKTITLKLKCVDFSVRSRAVSTTRNVRSKDDLYTSAVELLRKEMPLRLRLMGVRASALVALDVTRLADPSGETRKRQAMMDSFTTSHSKSSDGHLMEAMDGLVSTDEGDHVGIDIVQKVDGERGDQPPKIHGDQKRQLAIQTFTQKQAFVVPIEAFTQPSQPKRVRLEPSPSVFTTITTSEGQQDKEFQPCPVCGKMINAGNVIAINLHVEACLRRSEGEDKRRSFQQFFRLS